MKSDETVSGRVQLLGESIEMRLVSNWGWGLVIILCGWMTASVSLPGAEPPVWKVGVAATKITPEKSMWMAGYASRKSPSAGVVQDLYAKALVLEDEAGQRLVIITLDLIGVPRELRNQLAAVAKEQFGLPHEALLLNASHTHCGPELRLQRVPLEGSPEEVEKRLALALEYSTLLREKLVALLGTAIQSIAPAHLDYQTARCGFAMNRRRPSNGSFVNSSYSDGPIDHAVPVLRVSTSEGKLRALLFGYACHNTTLSFDFFCGDYAGYAQEFLQADHPEVTALFMTGCGGDQNPYPRSKLELAQQHGRALANAVDAALTTVPRPVRGPLRVRYGEVKLDFAPPPSREQLEKQAAGTSEPLRGHARRLLKQLEDAGKIVDSYEYPIQVVGFGQDLLLVALAGETVVDYSLRLKQELGGKRPVWVAGYSNDVFGYVPSLRVLREGGYEGGEAMLWGALPGPFAPSVEQRIMDKLRELVDGL